MALPNGQIGTMLPALSNDATDEEWLQFRKFRILPSGDKYYHVTGTDSASILGKNKFKSNVELYREKLDPDCTPQNEDEQSFRILIGKAFEDMVAKRFQKAHPEYNVIVPEYKIYQNVDYNFLIGSFDRLLTDESGTIVGGLECKTSDPKNKDYWDELEGIAPDSYVFQVMHYLMVSGLQFWWIRVDFYDDTSVTLKYDRSDPLFEEMFQEYNDFIHSLEQETEPQLLEVSHNIDLLKKLYPNSRPKSEKKIPPSLLDNIKQYLIYKNEEKVAKEIKEIHESKIKAFLGDTELGTIEWFNPETKVFEKYQTSWKTGQAFDEEMALAKYPEQVAPFTTIKVKADDLKKNNSGIYDACKKLGSRTFNVKNVGEAERLKAEKDAEKAAKKAAKAS